VILIQILLPLYDNSGKRVPRARFERTAEELARKFGGLTAYTRAPAKGLWRKPGAKTAHDDIVIYEVMSPRLAAKWWRQYRRRLEWEFRQHEIIIRAQQFRQL
jgi:hypothetical protein